MHLLLLASLCVSFVFSDTEIQRFVPESQKFAENIYQEVQKIELGDFMISPLSIQIILALVAAGAKGTTGDEIRKALQLPNSQSEVNKIFAELLPTIKGNAHYNLTTANRIFVKDNFTINTNFKNVARRDYLSGIEAVNFNKTAESAAHINEWVEKQTNNKIKNIITQQDITPDLRLILINTLYFSGNWSTQFHPAVLRRFYTSDGRSKQVPMMNITGTFNYSYSSELDSELIELPYIDNEVKMVIALPRNESGLTSLENRIGDVLSYTKFSERRVYVQLPKFSTETTINTLKELLENLGIKLVFTDLADLSGIAPNLKVSKIVQKTFINVTESGTEAAAATGVISTTTSILQTFIASHPFLYCISTKNNVPLFVGRHVGTSRQ